MGDKTPKSHKSKPSSPANVSRQEAGKDHAAGDETHRDRPDPVEEASMDSFPASDPPSYEPLRAGDPEEESRPEKRTDRDERREGGEKR